MNEEKYQALNHILFDEDGFLIKLRMGYGFDIARYQEVEKLLELVAFEYKESTVIPKKIAMLLFDIPLSMNALSDMYTGDSKELIFEKSIKIADLIRECFAE